MRPSILLRTSGSRRITARFWSYSGPDSYSRSGLLPIHVKHRDKPTCCRKTNWKQHGTFSRKSDSKRWCASLDQREHLRRLVSTLRRLRFLGGRGELIEAGPLLELGIDGEKMTAFIRRRVLADLLEKDPSTDDEAAARTAEDQLLSVLEEFGREVSMNELAQRMGERPTRLRELLRDLEERGMVARRGERAKTRYRLREG